MMEQGTMGELLLTRSVIKHIRKQNKSLKQGAGVGNDYSAFSLFENEFDKNSYLIAAEAVAFCPHIAWFKALNNLAVSGGRPIGVRLLLLLPVDEDESRIKEYMAEFNGLAEKYKIQIMGGHTQVSENYEQSSFCVVAVGMTHSLLPDVKEIKPGFDIVMTKYAGLLGGDLLIKQKKDRWKERFAESYFEEAKVDIEEYDVTPAVRASLLGEDESRIYYMHDVSTGGVYGALWQLAEKVRRGININHYMIPVKQEIIELCEFFDINPYMLDGTGALLLVTDNGENVVKRLEDHGISSAVIGRIAENQDKAVCLGEVPEESSEKRYLTPVKGDEIYKVIRRERA